MAITIEGYFKRTIFDNGGDFKVYSFVPLHKYNDMVKVHPTYGTMSISGVLPTMIEDVLYKIDVEYVKRGQYDNYSVVKVHSTIKDMDTNSTLKFLVSIKISENRAKELVKAYPNIIQMILNDEHIDVSKVKGVGESTLNKIKDKVIENFQLFDLVEEYNDYGMTIQMMQKLYEHYNKSAAKVKEKMDEDPYYCLCQINRVGFKLADSMIMTKYPQKIDSRMRAESCIRYLLSQNELSGNTWISSQELLVKFDELAREARKHFSTVIKECDDIFYESNTKTIAYTETRLCEVEIANILAKMNRNSVKWDDIDVEEYRSVDGINLTDEQMSILHSVCNNNVNILAGYAGAGKSFSMQGVMNMLDDNIKNYIVLSSTGKSAKVLSQYINKEVQTIHRGLGYKPPRDYKYNMNNKLPYDIVIVEEFSMVDIFLLRDLLRAIDTRDTKILFIGDPAQIPSVSVGNISYDMIQSEVIPTSLLTTVFRYGEGGLSYVASRIREGKSYLNKGDAIQTFGTNKDYRFINSDQEYSVRYVRHIYSKYLESGKTTDDILVLTAYNKGDYGTIILNRTIQELVNPNAIGVTVKRSGADITYKVGDKVMQIKNNYKVETEDEREVSVFNGDIGVIKKITKDEVTVEMNNEMIVYEVGEIANQIDLAYCISIHKSQGSGCKHVILITPKAHKFFLDRNLLYVAATRSKETLDHIGTIDVVSSALRKSANMSRNTYLKGLLQDRFK